MPAYVIFIRERTLDESELEAYAKLAGPSLEGLPIKFLAAYGRQEVLEGPAPEGVAIAEFPSVCLQFTQENRIGSRVDGASFDLQSVKCAA
jgi:uncharacterized protein (DUF1330 family)